MNADRKMRGSIDDSHKTTGKHGDEPRPIMIRSHTFEEYVKRVRTFHSYAAPGVIIGGFMIDLAYRHLPEEGFFNVLCETPKCLPDAVQLLTPCTVGNGWLTVVNVGRYALTLYNRRLVGVADDEEERHYKSSPGQHCPWLQAGKESLSSPLEHLFFRERRFTYGNG